MRIRLSLAAQILVLQIVIVTVTVGVGAVLTVAQARQRVAEHEGARMLAIAESVAAMPSVREAFDDPDPSRVLQPLATTIRAASDVTFVVIANRDQVRYAHPNPEQVGRRLSTDASTALSGRAVVTTQTGTLGRSVRAKVPVYDDRGQVIGVVSVGNSVEHLGALLQPEMERLAMYLAVALALGAAGSWLLAWRVKRQTFGLEPAGIRALLEQREATLHGIREGVVVVDGEGRVTLANDEAVRLLAMPPECIGRRVDELDVSPRLRDVLSGVADGADEIVLRAGRVLILNRMPVHVHGRAIGWVVTLRDRTELDRLTRELDGARSTTSALRAQAHEFSNRLHTLAGLIELGEHDEALRYVHHVSAVQDDFAAHVTGRVREPTIAALLVAKASYAREHSVDLRLAAESDLPAASGVNVTALATVVGNLVDNAVEALNGEPGWVEVSLTTDAEGVLVAVRDSGPGVAPELAEEVFRDGFTTKIARSAGTRGLGLALTRQACVTRGGWVDVRNEGGAVFTALLPREPAVTA